MEGTVPRMEETVPRMEGTVPRLSIFVTPSKWWCLLRLALEYLFPSCYNHQGDV